MELGCNKKTTVVCLITCSIAAAIYAVWYTAKCQQQGENRDHDVTRPEGFTDPTLKFVAVLFRHGDRAPVFKYKTDPHKMAFPEGAGELTKKGKQHMYKKGQFFRRLYNGYISDLYLDSEILMKTTNIRRTYMSAAMVLTGMYPPKSYQKWSDSETVWQPIPIYNDSPDHGTLFGEKGKCPVFDKICVNLMQTLTNATKKETETLFQYLSEKCGQPITNVNSLSTLYDVFLCQIADGLQPPKWTEPNILKEIKSINENTFKNIFKNTQLQNFVVGPLLQEIVSNMVLHSNTSNTARKLYLYAGHDISIGMAMGFMEDYSSISGFGGSLHFHLYLNKTNRYIIKMFYYNQWDNEKGEEVNMTKCGNPCKIQDFIKLVKNTNTSKEWEEECQKVES